MTSILTSVTLEDQFKQQTANDVMTSLQGLIRLYLTPYSKFWGRPITGSAPAGSPGNPTNAAFAALTPARRIAALGTTAVSTFTLNAQLKGAIEQIVNSVLAAIGKPAAGSTLAFLLPFVGADGVFVLPGIPDGYTFTPAADGSATLTEASA